MQWFGAKLLFKHVNPAGEITCYEESVRLVRSANIRTAELEARDAGQAEAFTAETDLPGPQSESCRFCGVLDVYAIGSAPAAGVEVYATTMSAGEAKLLRDIYPAGEEDPDDGL